MSLHVSPVRTSRAGSSGWVTCTAAADTITLGADQVSPPSVDRMAASPPVPVSSDPVPAWRNPAPPPPGPTLADRYRAWKTRNPQLA